MKVYDPVHCHLSMGSLGDSVLKISEYVEKAKEYGLTHLTMTDHGSLSAMYSFYNECRKHDIIPVIGIEMYEAADRFDKSNKKRDYSHLVLIAKNMEGMQNLFTLANDAHINGFYYEPRTDMTMLSKHGKGIIALSACVGGSIPQAILQDDAEKAVALIEAYKSCFDEFYLEIQPGKFDEQIKVNDALVELASYTDTPLVATNDIHYLNADDYIAHNTHVSISRKKIIEKDSPLLYPDTCYWFMDRGAIEKAFAYTEFVTPAIVQTAIDNTSVIVNQCDVHLSTELRMPVFSVGEGETEEEVLNRLCFDKLNEKLPYVKDPAKYVERLLYELSVIKKLGFCGYFLVVYDYIDWAKKNGVAVGPGRGSIGGSMCAYVLGISLADPIKYNLLFERFLSPHRASVPDCAFYMIN